MKLYSKTIQIDSPDSVFDGQHETTKFLLYYLNRYVTDKIYIDAGCGNGVLAIFAAKKNAKSVTAVDIDMNAIDCTLKNAKMNGVDITLIHSDIEKLGITADIVTANFARDNVLVYIEKLKTIAPVLITTWHKDIPLDVISDMEVIDHIEGIEYDCYVLKRG